LAGTGSSTHFAAGRKAMDGPVTGLRVQASTGTFTAGSINVVWEG
jgi:hypothetical protein